MTKTDQTIATTHAIASSQPWLHQHGREIQAFGAIRQFPLGLSRDTRQYSCQRLNQLLADSQISLRDLQETSLADARGDLLPASSVAR